MTVNDGKGLLDNVGLIESLMGDCEKAVECIHCGRHLSFCKIMYDMVVKLTNLRNGVINDTKSLKEETESYKEMLRARGVEFVDISEGELSEEGRTDE